MLMSFLLMQLLTMLHVMFLFCQVRDSSSSVFRYFSFACRLVEDAGIFRRREYGAHRHAFTGFANAQYDVRGGPQQLHLDAGRQQSLSILCILTGSVPKSS